jgi:hypothetical protein
MLSLLQAVFYELLEHFQLKHRNIQRTIGIFLENDTIPLIVTLYMPCGAVIPWFKDYGSPETMIKIVSHNSAPAPAPPRLC